MLELLDKNLVEENYQPDIFSEIDDDEIAKEFNKVKKRTLKNRTNKRTVSKLKRQKKSNVLPKSVVELQARYDEIASKENATSKDWEVFYKSIEKLIMKQAYFNNFKNYIEKDSELWCHLVTTLMDQIIPKKNIDGTKSCWYIDKKTNKICKGYDPAKSNIGNFILNRIKWIIVNYNKSKASEMEMLNDLEVTPLQDNFEFPEIEKTLDFKEQILINGDSTKYVKEINFIMQFHSFMFV